MTDPSPPGVNAYVSVMDFRVLGPIDVLDGDRHVSLGGPKQRTVLALLVASAGRMVTTDSLITGVYGEDAPTPAKRSIHTYVSNLRHELGDAIAGHGNAYHLEVEDHQIDALRFETAIADADTLLPDDPETASSLIRGSLAMWRGHAYGDLEGGPVLSGEAMRLEEMRMTALAMRIDADLALGLHRQVIGELDALIIEYPYQERFRALHMLALYRSDRQSEALRSYTRARTFLGDQLGLDPGAELQRLEQRILDHDPSLELVMRPTIEKRAIVVSDLPDELRHANPSARDLAMARRERTLLRKAMGNSAVVELRGTAVYVALAGVAEALDLAQALAAVGVTVAVDYGDVEVRAGEASGVPIARSARLVATAHPGQVILSEQAHIALNATGAAGWAVRSLGTHRIRGIEEPVMVYQATGERPDFAFPPLRLDRLPPPLPGTQPSLAGYELRTLVSEADFGSVYTAYQHSVGREVSVLVFSPDLVPDPAFIRRFEAEAHRLAQLDHPIIVPVLDYWREPEKAVIVCPLRRHRDLAGMLGPDLDQDTIVTIIARLGRGLAHAHDRGVMHGALKPSSVTVDDDGDPALSGLGVAWITDGLSPITTDAYTAAERLGGQLTPASDVFSLGAIAIELLSGVPLPADRALPEISGPLGAVVARAVHPDPAARYQSIGMFVDELVRASGGPEATSAEQLTVTRNPYKGLKMFAEVDAPDFFGRDRLTEEIVAAVATSSLTVVVGPSGIGKSSLVRAGLLPALRRGALEGSQDWLFTDLFPGAHPFAELAAALSRVASHTLTDEMTELRGGEVTLADVCEELSSGGTVLLVVDQLEELFTLTDDHERQRFLSTLTPLAGSAAPSVRVVATLRADFFDRPLADAGFGEAIRDRLVAVAALDVDELVAAIVRPAESVGVTVDAELAAEMAHDAVREPGGLPLLQHNLTEMFADRTSDQLTLADYRRSGGLVGSIGRRAETTYLDLPAEMRTATREVFLQLVTVDEVSQDTRRRVDRRELETLSVGRTRVEAVLEAFGRRRLLTFDRDPVSHAPTVEVAHEAILREWDRLVGWIDAARDDLLTRRRVEAAATEWQREERDPSFLLTGAHLENVEAWQQRGELELTEAEQEYLAESRRVFDHAQTRRRRARRRALVSLTLGLAAVSVLALVALLQGRAASRQATENRLAALVDEAYVAMDEDPNLAMGRALQAYETSRQLGAVPVEVASVLVRTLIESTLERVIDDGHSVLAPSPDGTAVALDGRDDHRALRLYDLASGNLIRERTLGAEILGLTYHPDGSQIAVGLASPNGGVIVDSTTLETIATISGRDPAFLSYSDDGRFLVGLVNPPEGNASVWRVENGYDAAVLEGSTSIPAFLRGTSILARSIDGDLEFLDLETMSMEKTMGLPDTGYFQVAVHPDGDLVALVADSRDRAVVASFEQGRVVLQPAVGNGSSGRSELESLTFTADGNALVLGGMGPVAVATDLSTLDRTQLGGHGSVITAMAAAGDRLLTQSLDRGLRIWRTGKPPAEEGSIDLGDGEPFVMAVDPANQRAIGISLLEEFGAAATLVDLATGETVRREFIRRPWGHPVPSLHPPLVAGMLPGGSGVVDLESGDEILPLRECEIPIGISGPAGLIAVRGECPTEGSRSGLIDISTNEMVLTFSSSSTLVAAFGPAGTPAADLVMATNGSQVDLWQISTRKHLGRWSPPDGLLSDNVQPAGFSQDGEVAYVGYISGRLVIFDVEALRQGSPLDAAIRFHFMAHEGPISHVDAAADFIITAGVGVRLWSSSTGELLLDLPSVDDVAVAIEPDGSAVYYDAGASVMRRIPTDLDQLAEQARSRLARTLTPADCIAYLTEDECTDMLRLGPPTALTDP